MGVKRFSYRVVGQRVSRRRAFGVAVTGISDRKQRRKCEAIVACGSPYLASDRNQLEPVAIVIWNPVVIAARQTSRAGSGATSCSAMLSGMSDCGDSVMFSISPRASRSRSFLAVSTVMLLASWSANKSGQNSTVGGLHREVGVFLTHDGAGIDDTGEQEIAVARDWRASARDRSFLLHRTGYGTCRIARRKISRPASACPAAARKSLFNRRTTAKRSSGVA